MSDDATLCEYIGCDNDGWVVLHFGPNLTPPLRTACMTHKTCNDLDMFRERHCTCGIHATVIGTVPDPGCPFHGEGRA